MLVLTGHSLNTLPDLQVGRVGTQEVGEWQSGVHLGENISMVEIFPDP